MAEELKQSVEEIKEDTLQTTQQEEPQAEATEEPQKGEKKLMSSRELSRHTLTNELLKMSSLPRVMRKKRNQSGSAATTSFPRSGNRADAVLLMMKFSAWQFITTMRMASAQFQRPTLKWWLTMQSS